MIIQYFFTWLLVLFLSCQTLLAQSPSWNWAKQIGGSQDDYMEWITTDSHGNVYTTGWFRDTVDFDPGPGVFELIANVVDGFIYKSDSAGNFIWAKQIESSFFAYSYSLAIDASENIICSGEFSGTTDFDPGPGIFNVTFSGQSTVFVLKLDSSGSFIWVDTFASSGNSFSQGTHIHVSSNNDIYSIGYITGIVDIDPGPGIFNLVSNGSSRDIFIAKIDSSGNFIWAKTFDGPSMENIGSIVTDNWENVYVTGHFPGTVDFDPGPGIYNMSSSVADMFIVKLDSSGNFKWAKQMVGSTAASVGHDITTDIYGNVYTTGLFGGTTDFDPGASTFPLTFAGYGAFVSKLDSSGNFIWAKAMGGPLLTDGVVGKSILLDPDENVIIAGFFESSFDADPGPATFNLTCNGYHDSFIIQLNNSRNFNWALSFGGTHYDYNNSIAMDLSGALYLTGFFTSTSLSFGPHTLFKSNYSYDCYIAKLGSSFLTGFETFDEISSNTLVYPNPASGDFMIKLPIIQDQINLIISDAMGRVHYESTVISNNLTNINSDYLIDGLYFLKIETKYFSKTLKLIIQH